MSIVESIQLLPPGHGGDTMSMSPTAQVLARGLEALAPSEKAAVFEVLVAQPGASDRLAKRQFQATWAGLGIGLILGVGGLYLTGKTLGWCR